MNVKAINQKSKIALFAVILVALIGLVLSVGSIVNAQELTQEEGTNSATDTTQPAATYNDANSLLGNIEGSAVNEEIVVRVSRISNVETAPSGWTLSTSESFYEKTYQTGTPVATIKDEWSKCTLKKGYLYHRIRLETSQEEHINDVLLSTNNNSYLLDEFEVLDRVVIVKDASGNLLKDVQVKSNVYTENGNPELLVSKTDENGKAAVKLVEHFDGRVDLAKDGYQNMSMVYTAWEDEEQTILESATAIMSKISTEYKYLNFRYSKPTVNLINMKGLDPTPNVAFSESLDLEKTEMSEIPVLKVTDSSSSNPVYLLPASGSNTDTKCNFYFIDNDGMLTKLPDDKTTTIDETSDLLCVATYDNKNQITIPASDKFTFTFKWTIGDTEYVNTTSNELSQYIDPNMKFKVDGNVITGINDTPTNDSMADKVEIIANPNSGYVLKNWQQDGVDIKDGTEFEMTTNTIFAFTAVAEEAPVTAHQLTINYKFENGTEAAPSYIGTLNEGEAYAVTSPAVEGYTPDIATVGGTMGSEDITTDVTYTPNGGGGGDTPGGGSDSAVASGTSSSSTGDFNSSAVMAIMGVVALAAGFVIAGRKKLFNK